MATSSKSVFYDPGYLEDGYFELFTVAPTLPANINLGSPGDAINALPYLALGGSVLDLDLLYGLVGGAGPTTDLQPIFAIATRNGLLRAYAERMPRQAIQDLCVQTFATLKSIDDITIEGSPIGPNLIGTVGLTTLPTFSARFNNEDGAWNRLVLEELIMYAPAGIYVDIAQTVVAPVITGTITGIVFDGTEVIVSGGLSTRAKSSQSLTPRLNLDQQLPLRTASIYAHPAHPTEILPEVFGNWLSPTIGPATSTDVGTPCVLINTLDLVYCANARATDSAAPVVMVNGVIQEPTQYTWNAAENYEGKGLIATLRFRLVYVIQSVVSVRHGGAVNAQGQPITNPFTMIETMLMERGHWTKATFDAGTCEQTRRDMVILGYPAYWVWNEEHTIREWLLELCAHYHCDFVETGNGTLAMIVDRTLTPLAVKSDYHVTMAQLDDHGSPATAIRLEMHGDDVVNQVTLHGRYNWATHETTVDYPWDYPQSQSAYGDPTPVAYPADFSFRGMYTQDHATQWLHSFGVRHGFDPTVVSFTLLGLHHLPLIPPRLITVESPWLGWVERLLKITKTTISFTRRAVDLVCLDCQRELDEIPDLPSTLPSVQSRPSNVIYNWLPGSIGSGGSIANAPVSQRNEAANGNFELGPNGQWDFFAGNGAAQWVIVDDAAGALIGTHYAVSVPNAGTGESLTLRQRIDPGEWVVASAWFRYHTAGTTGLAVSGAHFYDQQGLPLTTIVGNFVQPTGTYMESVAFGQAPPLAYYYRPGIGFLEYPTTGQWRADKVSSLSGSQSQVVASREGSQQTQNAIINGNFELGPTMFVATGGFDITNSPSVPARSGIWKAFHNPNTARFQVDRLNSLTQISVVAGQTLTMTIWGFTMGTHLSGSGTFGIDWIAPNETFLSEDAAAPVSPVYVNYTLALLTLIVPVGAAYAHAWIQITDHTGPGSGWVFDDWSIQLST